MEWYKTLNIHQKINLKSMFVVIGGIEFTDLRKIFSYSECFDIIYRKLQKEGFCI